MKTIGRNILAVVLGIIVGSAVNMGLISIGGSIIPPPDGADVTTMEGLQASMHLFQPRHFLFPFLAHALGTLAGAIIAALVATSNKMNYSLGIGACFLIGGTINVFLLPSPLWFSAIDLILAYIPMGYMGGKIALNYSHHS